MTFLIDGYNLMHAVGLASRTMAPGGLDRARTRFLDWLAEASAGRGVVVRVVFDAQGSPFRSPETDYRGVRVRFAARRTADDEIEELLAVEARPALVTVVSNDGRVRAAGRRRGCAVRGCEEFVDWCLSPAERPPPVTPEPAEKPEPPATPDEMAAWLAAFSSPPRRRKP